MTAAIAVMARSPFVNPGSIKTRLTPVVRNQTDRQSLYLAFLQDTIATVREVSEVALRVAFTPAGSRETFARIGIAPHELLEQRDSGLGDRERHVFEDLFADGFERVVLIGSDLPTLPISHLREALGMLDTASDVVVLGPADDGGYYLMGLRAAGGAPAPDLFNGIRWSTEFALTDTARAAAAAGLEVRFVPRWYDVDDEEGLRRLRRDLATRPELASATRSVMENLAIW